MLLDLFAMKVGSDIRLISRYGEGPYDTYSALLRDGKLVTVKPQPGIREAYRRYQERFGDGDPDLPD